MTKPYRCPVREGLPTNPPCLADLHVYGKRFYNVNQVTGALTKSSEQLYDVVCEHAHVLVEDATDIGVSLRTVLDIEHPSTVLDSEPFVSLLNDWAVAIAHGDKATGQQTVESMKRLIWPGLSQ